MSDIVSFSPVRALDRDGVPVSGALAYFYQSGTTTPQTVYTTAALDVAHPSPLVADSLGVFPPVFSAVALRCVVTDASGTTLPGFPIDPVATISTGSGADQVSFNPTGDIPETNVQAAIERVQANLVAPLLAGGIGVTGNADVLANLDATDTPSGAYRFTTGATGTFPSGVIPADGGTVRLWRETATNATMELNPAAGGPNVWRRKLSAGTWQPWQIDLTYTTAAAARATISAPSTPTLSDHISLIGTAAGVAYVTPAGGQWLVRAQQFDTTTGTTNFAQVFQVFPGGTSIGTPTSPFAWAGFAWRVS